MKNTRKLPHHLARVVRAMIADGVETIDDVKRILAAADKKRRLAVSKKKSVVHPVHPVHPPQPTIVKEGVLRFKANKIVQDLLDEANRRGGLNLNRQALGNYDNEDHVQFAQPIGYSVGGFADLSYVSDAEYKRVTRGSKAVWRAYEAEQKRLAKKKK
jgi:hypothetical protein